MFFRVFFSGTGTNARVIVIDNSGTPNKTKMPPSVLDMVVLETNCEPVVVIPPTAKFTDFRMDHSSTNTPNATPNSPHIVVTIILVDVGLSPNHLEHDWTFL